MTDVELNIEKFEKICTEIKLKYHDKLKEYSEFFIGQIDISKNNNYFKSIFYGNDKLYDLQVIENDVITTNLCYNQEVNCYRNRPKSALEKYAGSYSESYDDNGNRIENCDDLFYSIYSKDDNLISEKAWSDKKQSWINVFYKYEDNIKKILIGDECNNLINLILCKSNNDEEEIERFIYDSNLNLVLKKTEFDNNNKFLTSTSYLLMKK